MTSEQERETEISKIEIKENDTVIEIEEDPEAGLPEGIPYLKFFMVALTMSCDTLGLTFLFPFLSFMVADFGYSGTQNGLYAGILASSFPFAEFLSSLFYGVLSDKIGRRPVLLWGLLGNAITLVAFGLSPNFACAVLFRSMTGFLNGNFPVCKTYLAEICRKKHHPTVFSITGLLWGLGNIVGPLIGGFSAQPASKYESFKDISLFIKFPYLFPCLLFGFYQLFGFVLGYFYLTESPTILKEREIIAKKQSDYRMEKNLMNNRDDQVKEEINNEPKFKKLSFRMWMKETVSILKDRNVVIASVIYGIIGICYVMFDEIFAIWARSPINLGGIDFSTDDIGISLG